MKARVDVGTDVAMVGAWDAQRNADPAAGSALGNASSVLEADAAEGHVFVLHTGRDGGGPVDLYIGEAIPDDVLAQLKPVEGEFLLAVPSGQLLIGGAEDYRAAAPKITGPNSVVTVPSSDYVLRCYVAKETEQTPTSEATLRKRVGRTDLEYYDRINRVGCLGGALSLLLFPILSFQFDWRLALAITVVVFLSFFPTVQWLLKRNARYQRLHAIVPAFRLQNEDAWLVFALDAVRDRAGRRGGVASL
jgi:hypothetical protein